MKWSLNPCRRYRRSLCLLAGGVLSGEEKIGVENHLADCADCRGYYDEIKAVTAPLAGWGRHFAHVEPTPETQSRWAKTIQAAADVNRHEEPVRELTFAATVGNAVRLSFQELVWPCRHIWAGLATVWILILVADISMQDHSPTTLAKGSQVPEIFMTWQQQERLVAELIDPNEVRAAEPPKSFPPQPRSEQCFGLVAV
jgi:hypothetical protein